MAHLAGDKQMRSFEIVQADTDRLTSHSGLALVGRAIACTCLARDLATIPLRHGIAHADCLISYVALLATGKSDFDAIEGKRADEFFKEALDLLLIDSLRFFEQAEVHAGKSVDSLFNAKHEEKAAKYAVLASNAGCKYVTWAATSDGVLNDSLRAILAEAARRSCREPAPLTANAARIG